jgi:hypothetical protein
LNEALHLKSLTKTQHDYNQLKGQRDLFSEQLLGYWIRGLGITKKDLDRHPQINDLMLLIQYREEFYADQKAKHKKFFNNTWNCVYTRRLPLTAKQLRTLRHYAQGTVAHRENVQTRVQQQRQTIKARIQYRKALEAR